MTFFVLFEQRDKDFFVEMQLLLLFEGWHDQVVDVWHWARVTRELNFVRAVQGKRAILKLQLFIVYQ